MFNFGKPSKKTFANQLKSEIESQTGWKLTFDKSKFMLFIQDGGELNLTNVYNEHCRLDKSDRKEHIQKLVAIFSQTGDELPEDFSEARENLRPKIWCRATIAHMELKQKKLNGEELDMPLYPIGSHLYSSLVYDTEHSMRSLSNDDLENWGVTYYEAFEIARDNLNESTVAFAKIGDNFVSSMTGDNYDSARILLVDRIKTLEVAGEPIASVPHRDQLLVAGSDDDDSLRILLQLTAEQDDEPVRPLSPLPVILRDGEWIDWEPPKNHVLRVQYEKLQLEFMGQLYTDQQEALNDFFCDDEDAPFVASFSAIRKDESEEVQSYCVWTNGVDSLLPRTNLILLGDRDDVCASGEWEHVASVVGDLLVADQSYYPTRYRVSHFPTEEQLSAIGNFL